MGQTNQFLPGKHERSRYMRIDTAEILKRFVTAQPR